MILRRGQPLHEPAAGKRAGFGKFGPPKTPCGLFMESEGIPLFRDIGAGKVRSCRRSSRDRSACSAPRRHSVNELTVFHNGNSVHQHKRYTLGILQWLVKRGFIDDAGGIKDRDVGIGADANTSFIFECRRALLQTLRGH